MSSHRRVGEQRSPGDLAVERDETLPAPAHNGRPAGAGLCDGSLRWWVLAFVAIAAGWRVVLAVATPCISRDGVVYCWFARDLGRIGREALRDPAYQQHPLYSLTILAVQRMLRALGWADTPELWQAGGQIVSIVAGAALVVLSGAVALRLSHYVRPSLSPTAAAKAALAFSTLLPLGTLLSASVLSDTLHAAFYLAAVLCLLGAAGIGATFACGVLSGMAFVTRPEGLSVALVAGAAMLVARPRPAIASLASRLTALVLGVVLAAAPYWLALGGFSPKLEKETVEEFVPARLESPGPAQDAPARAALVRRDVGWYAAAPWVTYELFRAGRVVVPLLAIAPLYLLVRNGRRRAPAMVLGCAGLHFALASVLLVRHGYLAPRHLLVLVQLLLPLAAVEFAWLHRRFAAKRNTPALAVLYAACFLPYAAYATRVPNGADGALHTLAERLVERGEAIGDSLLLGGASERRIAFYADLRFQPWPENEPDPARRLEELRRHLFDARGVYRPQWFAITVGGGAETEGNAALLESLRGLPVGAALIPVDEQATITGARVLLFRVITNAPAP